VQQLALLLPPRLEHPPKAFGVENDRRHPRQYEEKQRWCRFLSRLPAFALPRQNAPEGQPLHWKQLGNPALSAHAAILAKVELEQTVENIRRSVVLTGLLGFPPSGD
jgi:hypothetical protein